MPDPARTTLLRPTRPAPLPPSAGPGGEPTVGVWAPEGGRLVAGGEPVGGAVVGSSAGGATGVGTGEEAGGTNIEGGGEGGVEGDGVGARLGGAGAGVGGLGVGGVAGGLPAGAGVGACAMAETAKKARKRRVEKALAIILMLGKLGIQDK